MKIFLSIALALVSFSSIAAGKPSPEVNVSLGFYNLHNLFDTEATIENGERKNDWAYLPKDYPGKIEFCKTITNEYYKEDCLQSDWTQEKFEIKISQLHKGLLNAFTNLPDILGVCEIENEVALQALQKKMGYSHSYITQSKDERGIDVALLFNLKDGLEFVGTNIVEIDPTILNGNKTRDILEVQFKIAGKDLSVFVNHWPSQGNPAQNRHAVAKILKPVIDARIKSGASVVLTGDFNTLEKDRPHPFYDVLYTGENKLTNVHNLYRKHFRKEAKELPLGTYYYVPKMEWNMLDLFFVSDNMVNGNEILIDLKSYKIGINGVSKDFSYDTFVGPQQGSLIKNIPFKSNNRTTDLTKVGFSDHFPIWIDLKAAR